jgi:hypothetical protein
LDKLEPAEPAELIFAGVGRARLANWSKWSAQMQRRLGFDVTPHALRRTSATLAGDLGHPPHVVSALLGHREIGGDLHDGYNQSRYRAEVADALQKVADRLDALAGGEDKLSRRRGALSVAIVTQAIGARATPLLRWSDLPDTIGREGVAEADPKLHFNRRRG